MVPVTTRISDGPLPACARGIGIPMAISQTRSAPAINLIFVIGKILSIILCQVKPGYTYGKFPFDLKPFQAIGEIPCHGFVCEGFVPFDIGFEFSLINNHSINQ